MFSCDMRATVDGGNAHICSGPEVQITTTIDKTHQQMTEHNNKSEFTMAKQKPQPQNRKHNNFSFYWER